MVFIPGVSTIKADPQSPEENAETYAESQQQRALERKLREEKRELEIMKAQGAPDEEIRAQRAKVRRASSDIDAFCDETGRTRRRANEYTPVNASFPDKGSYDPSLFPTDIRDSVVDWLQNGNKYGIIDMEIDELTPCLKRVSDGAYVETTIRKISPTKSTAKGWEFDWTIPEKNGYDVYALRVKGDKEIQGMIAMKKVASDHGYHIDIVESAPQNSTHNPRNHGTKKYDGVGAHLFAEACKRSYDDGYEGFVYFTAKTNLIEHYQKTLGAEVVDYKYRIMMIQGEASVNLINKYYGGSDDGN